MTDLTKKTTEELDSALDEALGCKDPTCRAESCALVRELRRRRIDLTTFSKNAVYAGGLQVADRRNDLRNHLETQPGEPRAGDTFTGPGCCFCGLALLRDGPIASCPVHGGEYRG